MNRFLAVFVCLLAGGALVGCGQGSQLPVEPQIEDMAEEGPPMVVTPSGRGDQEEPAEIDQEAAVPPGALTEVDKQRIEQWLVEQGLNPYGDPRDMMYTGGTPLFDEKTGRTIDRYEYILKRHPELRQKLRLNLPDDQ